jgi:hypothetical protein
MTDETNLADIMSMRDAAQAYLERLEEMEKRDAGQTIETRGTMQLDVLDAPRLAYIRERDEWIVSMRAWAISVEWACDDFFVARDQAREHPDDEKLLGALSDAWAEYMQIANTPDFDSVWIAYVKAQRAFYGALAVGRK